MSRNHTKEPWKYVPPMLEGIAGTIESSVEIISAIYNPENARRIVACINSCAGVSTELLETSPDLSSAFISAENARLMQLNYDLWVSLQDILSRFKSCIRGGNGELNDDAQAIQVAEYTINHSGVKL